MISTYSSALKILHMAGPPLSFISVNICWILLHMSVDKYKMLLSTLSSSTVLHVLYTIPYWRVIRHISLIGTYSLLSAYFAAVLNIPALEKSALY